MDSLSINLEFNLTLSISSVSIKFLDSSHEKKELKLKKFQNILNLIFYKKNRLIKEKIKIAAKIQFELRRATNKKIFIEEGFYKMHHYLH